MMYSLFLLLLISLEVFGSPQAVNVKAEDLITARKSKEIKLPEPFVISSASLWVKDRLPNPEGSRQGRSRQSFSVGNDGIPVIEGIRSPDDPNDTRVFRNARVINNILVPNEPKETKLPEVKAQSRIVNLKPERPSRVLFPTDVSRSPRRESRKFVPFNLSQLRQSYRERNEEKLGRKYPAFYYRDFYDPDRSLKVEDDQDPMESSSSQQIVKLARPPKSKSVDSGSGMEVQPRPENIEKSVEIEARSTSSEKDITNYKATLDSKPFKASKSVKQFTFPNVKQDRKNIAHNALENSLTVQRAQLQSIASNPPSTLPTKPPMVGPPDASLINEKYIQSLQQLIEHQKQFQANIDTNSIQANPPNYDIQDTIYPGYKKGPTFNVPIPYAQTRVTSKYKRPQDTVFSGSEAINAIASPFESSYIRYDSQPYEVHGSEAENNNFQDISKDDGPVTRPSFFSTLMEPMRRLFQPMFQPFFTIQDSLRTRFDVPEDMTLMEKFSDNVNDYVSRTFVAGDVTPVLTVLALLTAGGLAIYASTLSSNTTVSLGRSLENNLINNLSWEEKLLDNIETYTEWTDIDCAKWAFCQTMSTLPEDRYDYPYEEAFSDMLDIITNHPGNSLTMKSVAQTVMKGVRSKSCNEFKCLPDDYLNMDVPSFIKTIINPAKSSKIELIEEI